MAEQPITGYRELTTEEVNEINGIKEVERLVAKLWRDTADGLPSVDRRWTAVARTHFQEGFTALVRAIARPHDPFES